jgi:phage shock protein A
MGIFQKLSLLIRSNLNDLIARAENPEKMLEQVIMDMREQQTKAKQEVALAIAEERKLKAQVETEAKQSQEWERRAVLALQQGREDLARQALLRQQEYAERARSLHETWQRQAADTEKVKDALRQLQVKIEEAQRKKNLLVAKQKRAQAQKRIHETMAGLSDTSAFETFERMAQKIEHTERLALAAAEVSEELSGDPLEKQFKALEASSGSEDIEYRLLEMKQKMGLALPAGAPAATGQSLPGTAQGGLALGAGATAAATGGPPPAAPGRPQDASVHDAELADDDGSAQTAQERSSFAPLPPPPSATPQGGGAVSNDRDLAAQIDALNRGA